jgi:transposase-like protein
MVQKRGKYEDEFKREAVRLADESEKSAAQIARDLGIHRNLL